MARLGVGLLLGDPVEPCRAASCSPPSSSSRCRCPALAVDQRRAREAPVVRGAFHLHDGVDDLLGIRAKLSWSSSCSPPECVAAYSICPRSFHDRRLDGLEAPPRGKPQRARPLSSAARTLRFCEADELLGLRRRRRAEQLRAEAELLGRRARKARRETTCERIFASRPSVNSGSVVQSRATASSSTLSPRKLQPLVGRRPVGGPRRVGKTCFGPVGRKRANQLGQPPDVACPRVAATGGSRR